MTANGFLEQKPAKATSLGIVLTLHAAVIGGVLMLKGQEWIRKASEPTNVFNVRPETPPPPDDVIPERQQLDTQRQTRMDVPPQIIPTPLPTVPAQVNRDPPVDYTPSNTGTPTGTGTREVAEVRIPRSSSGVRRCASKRSSTAAPSSSRLTRRRSSARSARASSGCG